ncbi:unnamed protein product [Brachionus calyciflorus]|uniref:Uncharacterized protein n=1 Tax=Brachionus calyciflorus TaxID=104777 RepID=A0A813S2P6_9BILA|nr:unnamed protein product [Brachionus calyciflorus]
MNEYSNLQSSSPRRRLSCDITVIGANCRDFDQKEKLTVLERKLEHENAVKEKKLKRSQKWDTRVEKNLIIKDIYSSAANYQPLSPSIDEWLNMSNQRRKTIAASLKNKK